jgi:drug/metabolite transporter (DMT)-like permease
MDKSWTKRFNGKIKRMQTGSNSPASTLGRGYMICFAGTIMWSTTGILIRYLTEFFALPPLILAVWRDLFVTLGLIIGLAVLRPRALNAGRENLLFLLGYGFVVSLFNASWTFSVALNGAAVATVLAYSAPAYTALMGWRLFNEQMGWLKVTVIFLSILGCALVAGAFDPAAWNLNVAGVVTGLFSGVLFAVYNLMGKVADRRDLNSWTTLMYAFGFATLFLFSYNVIYGSVTDIFWLGSAAQGWLVLILLGIGPTIGGYGLYTLSLSYLPMTVASLIATLEPAFTAGLAYLFLGERMTPLQLLGSALILAGVILLRLRESRFVQQAR